MSSNTIVGLTNPSNGDDSVTKMFSNSFDADESVIIHKVEILDNLENIIERIEKIGNKLLRISEIGHDFRGLAFDLSIIKNDLKK